MGSRKDLEKQGLERYFGQLYLNIKTLITIVVIHPLANVYHKYMIFSFLQK